MPALRRSTKTMKPLILILGLAATSAILHSQEADQKKPEEPPKQELVEYTDYLGLLGQEFCGNVFVIRYNGRLVAVSSKHQFDEGMNPSRAENLDTDKPVELDRARKFEQDDVLIMPLRDQKEKIPFMKFNPDYTLKEGDALWITRGGTKEKKGTTGKLLGLGLDKGEFKSTDEPRELTFILDEPADVRGGSGLEVVHVETGNPIGVLLAANNGGKDATRIVFEPICLPIPNPDKAE